MKRIENGWIRKDVKMDFWTCFFLNIIVGHSPSGCPFRFQQVSASKGFVIPPFDGPLHWRLRGFWANGRVANINSTHQSYCRWLSESEIIHNIGYLNNSDFCPKKGESAPQFMTVSVSLPQLMSTVSVSLPQLMTVWQLLPWKLTCPPKIDGIRRCIPYWNGHFLGDVC